MISSVPPPPPPRPPLPPFTQPLFPLEEQSASGDVRRYSYNPSVLIIAAIIAAAIVAAASIHHLLRVLSRFRSPPFGHHLASSSSSSLSSSASAPSTSPSAQDPKAVIDSLPLFSLSTTTAKPSSSLDCAVCLSPFQIADEIRLLPACRHAFHSQCIDTWLKSNLSCPLCRSPIFPVPPPPPPPPPPPAEPARSDSFRVEIGTVSRRSDDSSSAAAAPPHARSYSLGSAFEYVVDEEIEAVLSRVRRRPSVEKSDLEQAPPPPGADVADIAGASRRSWLKEYVDRLASSASSSLSSLRFSQRGSHRFDPAPGVVPGGTEGCDLENLHMHLEEEDGPFSALYRWVLGAQP